MDSFSLLPLLSCAALPRPTVEADLRIDYVKLRIASFGACAEHAHNHN
jgi:hypothetical protein